MPFGSSSPIAANGALFQAGFRVFGLQCNIASFGNNVGVPGVQSTMSLIRPGNGDIIYAKEGGGNSANIGTAGPVAGGRDQVAAFPNNSLVHFYTISDGVSATQAIASLSPPFAAPTGSPVVNRNISTILLGPVLPTGFLYWNYAGCIPMNGANLYEGMYEGDCFNFANPPLILNSGLANGTFSLPTALFNIAYGVESCKLNLISALTTNGGGAAGSTLTLGEFGFGAGTTFQSPINVPGANLSINDSAQYMQWVHSFPAKGNPNFSFAWVNDVNPANIAARFAVVNLHSFRSAFSLKN